MFFTALKCYGLRKDACTYDLRRGHCTDRAISGSEVSIFVDELVRYNNLLINVSKVWEEMQFLVTWLRHQWHLVYNNIIFAIFVQMTTVGNVTKSIDYFWHGPSSWNQLCFPAYSLYKFLGLGVGTRELFLPDGDLTYFSRGLFLLERDNGPELTFWWNFNNLLSNVFRNWEKMQAL